MSGPTVLYSESSGLGLGDPSVSLAGTGESVPRGVEAVFQYNGLLMNDKSVIDRYRIISIDGLDDPDVRDSRDENPADDGETPNFSVYGGRTLAIQGRIEAYQLDKLRDMQQALRTAFADLSRERKLHFLTGDGDLDHYINCKKFSKNQWGEEQKHLNHFFRDFLITLRASDPRFYRKKSKSVTLYGNRVSNSSFETNTAGWANEIAGAEWTQNNFESSATWASSGTKSLRVKNTKAANTNSVLFYATTPTGTSGYPVAGGEDYKASVEINIINTPATQIGFTIREYNAAGTMIDQGTQIMSNQVGVHHVELSSTLNSSTRFISIAVYALSNVSGDEVEFHIDEVYLVNLSGNQSPGQISIGNEGNYKSFPRIRFHGLLDDVQIENLTNDKVFKLKDTATIPDGDFYEVDATNKTILDDLGVNKFGQLHSESDWLILEPGDNLINIPFDKSISGSANSRIVLTWNDAWI